jgi:hypothetical protein
LILTWVAGERAFRLHGLPSCEGAAPPPLDELLKVAKSLSEME